MMGVGKERSVLAEYDTLFNKTTYATLTTLFSYSTVYLTNSTLHSTLWPDTCVGPDTDAQNAAPIQHPLIAVIHNSKTIQHEPPIRHASRISHIEVRTPFLKFPRD